MSNFDQNYAFAVLKNILTFRRLENNKLWFVQVAVVGDVELAAGDFQWSYGPAKREIDFDSEKYSLSDDGMTIEVRETRKLGIN